MNICKEELLKILIAVKPALSKKEILLQMAHIIFTGEDVATFNDTLCIIHPYKTDFKCSVQGEEFYKALESIKEPTAKVVVEKEQVVIQSKSTRAGMSILLSEDEKVEDVIEELKKRTSAKRFWKLLPSNFVEGTFLCSFSASKDMNRRAYSAVCYVDDRIYSTDSLRASCYVMDRPIDYFLIAGRSSVELAKYNVTKYALTEGWAHFRTDDGVIFNCKTMEGDYPYEKLKSIFIKPSNEIHLPKELQEVMKTAAVFSEEDIHSSKKVEVTIEGDTITCRSKKERGWIEKVIEVEGMDAQKVQFYINPLFLIQVLDKSTTVMLIMKSLGTEGWEWPDKALFTNENFQHIISLAKEGEEPPEENQTESGEGDGYYSE